MKDNTKKALNKVMTVVVILLAALCIILAVKIIGGKDTSIFGFQIYHIMTGSMEPTIPTGSTVITKKVDPYTLKEGDVITFISRDEAIYGNANTHRIIGIDDSDGQRKFITKGDANGSIDSIEVPVEDVKGKVIFHANFKAFSLFLDFMRTGYGFITVIVLPFIFVLWKISQKLKEEIEEYSKQTAQAEVDATQTSAETSAEKQKQEAASEEFERIKAAELARLRAEAAAKATDMTSSDNSLEETKTDDKSEEFEKVKAAELARLRAEAAAQTTQQSDMKETDDNNKK